MKLVAMNTPSFRQAQGRRMKNFGPRHTARGQSIDCPELVFQAEKLSPTSGFFPEWNLRGFMHRP
jgi:hypothetical protein